MKKVFEKFQLKKLYVPPEYSNGEDNGQVTIIGGSDLFHGAPLIALKTASRFTDMVFFASPEPSVGRVAEHLKSQLFNFIWVDWGDLDAYIEKSDAVLIGPGFRRFGSEKTGESTKKYGNQEGILTRVVTESILKKFPRKKWVIDAGSLQTMEVEWLPKKAVITPNQKEFSMLFEVPLDKLKKMEFSEKEKLVKNKAEKYDCTIVLKGPQTIVASKKESIIVKGGNAGMTKGATGDILAGLTVGLLAKNNPFLAASSASFIAKASGDELYKSVGVNYNADDLADQIPLTFYRLLK